MKLGILGASEIALRRFLPALQKYREIEYAGVASRTPVKAQPFFDQFGGKTYPSYDALLADPSIDAVYVPLPPALHYEWGKKVLKAGKHLFMEKPFAAAMKETETLLELSIQNNLAVHENYMFLYHSQLRDIKERINSGQLGKLRLIRAAFGFPKRGENDFRYNMALGGGALLDCGGYPVRLATELLGESAKLVHANLSFPEGYDVDLYGNAVLKNTDGLCAQISFGMDNAYQCQLEIWGSEATLIAPRIFTAPGNFEPSLIIRDQSGEHCITLKSDDSFLRSIETFYHLVDHPDARVASRSAISQQASIIEQLRWEALHGRN